MKAREFDVKDVATDPDDASNASDDSMISVLEDRGKDPVADKLRGFIGALNEDERARRRHDRRLDELRVEAARAHDKRTAPYLLGMPLLADHLEEALSQDGQSCDDFEMGHL
jgi:hypothetical protein